MAGLVEKIILLGCGGHAKSVIDTIEQNGQFEIAGLVDKDCAESYEYRGYQIIGADEDLEKIYEEGIRYAFVSVGYMGKGEIRNRLYHTLKKIGYEVPSIIDNTAVIASDAVIGEGTYIGKKAVVNADAHIGKMCIINTAAVVEHECSVGDYSHVSVGSILCGAVRVKEACFIGAGATVIQGVEIGADCIVGAGAVIRKDAPERAVLAGNPAKIFRK